MSTSINVVCYKSKTLANGECPLMLCICKEGKRKYQSIGISIQPKQWDAKKNRPKPNCPNKEYIESIITTKVAELQETILILKAENRGFTSASLLQAQQAINFMNICKNGNPSTIEGLLHYQSPSIIKELKAHFDVDSLPALATAMSLSR